MNNRLLLLIVLVFGGCTEPAAPTAKPLQLSTVLGSAGSAGYATATGPVPITFPTDDGPHPAFRSEWWYWTGNLRTAEGREFGFQFTVFRFALAPEDGSPAASAQRASAWATREAWMAHLTLTDVEGRRFLARERSARGALGLAGATATPFAVWCDGWAIRGDRLTAQADGFALDLTLAPGKAPVLQGDQGYSRKGADPANSSLYYSRTRMPTQGTIRLDGTAFTVAGDAWMDREWSTSALEPGVVGWDWFALHLADGRDLMVYRLRTADGRATRFSSGSINAVDGTVTRLGPDDVAITPTGTWTSPRGVTYPSAWRLTGQGLDLTVTPKIPDQELDLSVRYWEGAVTLRGSTAGVGYVELAGY